MHRLLSTLFLYLAVVITWGQDGQFGLGARNAGLAGASITLSDGWSMFNNVGGLGRITRPSANVSYQNRFDLSSLQVVGLAYSQPTKFTNLGVGFFRFGDEFYSQQKMSLSLGNQIQMVSLGMSVNVIQYRFETIGASQAVSFEFGGIAEIIPQLRIGAHIFNINQSEITPEESIPVVMKTGISYRPTAALMINAEVQKDLDLDTNFLVGIEYKVIEWVRIRTGIGTIPRLAAFGLGIYPKNFILDYAYTIRNPLGGIHEISLAYQPNFGK